MTNNLPFISTRGKLIVQQVFRAIMNDFLIRPPGWYINEAGQKEVIVNGGK